MTVQNKVCFTALCGWQHCRTHQQGRHNDSTGGAGERWRGGSDHFQSILHKSQTEKKNSIKNKSNTMEAWINIPDQKVRHIYASIINE